MNIGTVRKGQAKDTRSLVYYIISSDLHEKEASDRYLDWLETNRR